MCARARQKARFQNRTTWAGCAVVLVVLFAVTYRERSAALVLDGTYARHLASEDYPWGRTLEQRAVYAAQIENEWGWATDRHSTCPSAEAALARWWGGRIRAAARALREH